MPNTFSGLKHQSDSRPSADHISRVENLTRIIILSQLGEVLLLILSVSMFLCTVC